MADDQAYEDQQDRIDFVLGMKYITLCCIEKALKKII